MIPDNMIITISHDSHVELTKMKRYNPKRKRKMDTYDDVIQRLIESKKEDKGGFDNIE